MSIEGSTDYSSKVFRGFDAKNLILKRSVFDDCRFVDCDFSGARIEDCRFRDCEFQNSNFSIVKCKGSKFIGVAFRDCKVTGVDWTRWDWSGYRLGSPLFFERSDISLSDFSSLVLRELCLRDCKAREVDFSDCDLEGADFSRTDFQEARFSSCRLDKCNFRGASNYVVDPLDSSIAKAQFSTPEVLTLLRLSLIHI